MQSPEKTDITEDRQRQSRFKNYRSDEYDIVEEGAGSQEGSLATSTCNDIEEHQDQLARMPKASNAAGMF